MLPSRDTVSAMAAFHASRSASDVADSRSASLFVEISKQNWRLGSSTSLTSQPTVRRRSPLASSIFLCVS